MNLENDFKKLIEPIAASLLILTSTLQKSKNEEIYTPRSSLLLPLLTIIYFFVFTIVAIYVPRKITTPFLLTFFVTVGYFTLYSNIFYIIEFFEYEVYVYEGMTISEMSFQELDDEGHKELKKDSKTKGLFKRLKKYILHTIYSITPSKFIIYLLSFFICLFYTLKRDEATSYIITISIYFHTVREIKVQSTLSGFLFLLIFFIYSLIDIVFGDFLKETINSIGVPIMPAFPVGFHVFDLLGFGDIFLPGIYIALVRDFSKKHKETAIYWVTYLSYSFGLFVPFIFDLKIPTLFLVCPLVVISSLIPVILYGKLKCFLKYHKSED